MGKRKGCYISHINPKPSPEREREVSPFCVFFGPTKKDIIENPKLLRYTHITHGRRTNQKKKTNTPTPQHNERGRAAERIPAVGSQHHRDDVGVDVVIAFFFDHIIIIIIIVICVIGKKKAISVFEALCSGKTASDE